MGGYWRRGGEGGRARARARALEPPPGARHRGGAAREAAAQRTTGAVGKAGREGGGRVIKLWLIGLCLERDKRGLSPPPRTTWDRRGGMGSCGCEGGRLFE